VRRHDVRRGWYGLLAVPLVGVLIPTIYNSADPTFIGIPFFYWYQMLWVLISTALTMLAYKLWQRDQRARGGQQGGASQ
jgi:hypothetical protein